MRIFITNPMQNLDNENWPRGQAQAIDKILGGLEIDDFGVEDGHPWIELPEAEVLKIVSPVSFVESLPAKTFLTLHEFRNRFTFEEKVLIQASTDPGVQVVQADLNAAQVIDLENAELQAGMGYLVSQDLISETRKAEILTA